MICLSLNKIYHRYSPVEHDDLILNVFVCTEQASQQWLIVKIAISQSHH